MPVLASGQIIADRYELLGEMPRAGGSLLHRARDLAFGEIVALKHLAPSPSARRALEAEVRRVQRSPHPSLVRILAIDGHEGVLVREWVHGFSLLDLIRRHRELPAPFALRLLEHLPAILDLVAAHSLPLPGSLLAKIFVRFAPEVSPETVAAQPITSWPAFSLKLNLISVRAALPEPDAENTAMTTMAEERPASGADHPPSTRLAALLYEILGGPMRNARERRYTPLPALLEEGNGVLRRALLDLPSRDCATLWADLVRAEPAAGSPAPPLSVAVPPAEPVWQRPASLPGAGEPGTVLKLTPAQPSQPALHVVARAVFKIGRSLQQADFVTRFLPPSVANDDLTNQLSRIHVLAERAGDHLALRDGNGSTPSVNGTTLDDEPLDASQPKTLRHRALLTLGGVFSLEIIPLTTPAAASLQIGGLEPQAVATPPGPGGAVFFVPIQRQPTPRDTVWIFNEAGFGLDAAQRIVWDTRGLDGSPASFFHSRGSFWLANRTLDSGVLRVAGVPLAAGEIAALGKGQELRISAHTFTIDLA